MLVPWLVAVRRTPQEPGWSPDASDAAFCPSSAMVVMAVLPILAFTGGSAVVSLASVSPYSITILVCSILFPLFALAGVVLGASVGAGRRASSRPTSPG